MNQDIIGHGVFAI